MTTEEKVREALEHSNCLSEGQIERVESRMERNTDALVWLFAMMINKGEITGQEFLDNNLPFWANGKWDEM